MDRNGLYRFQVSSLGIHYIAVFGTRKYFDLSSRISPHLAFVDTVCFRGMPSSALARLHHFYIFMQKWVNFSGGTLSSRYAFSVLVIFILHLLLGLCSLFLVSY